VDKPQLEIELEEPNDDIEVKNKVKLKKIAWHNYINDPNEHNSNEYKDKRNEVKSEVQPAKQKTWEIFGYRKIIIEILENS
jgi:hypothetical protein